MDTSIEKFFDCMCRTCMHELVEDTRPGQQWWSILDTIKECGSLLIDELLSRAVPQITMQSTEELPKKICCKCLEELQNIYRFQQMCLKSEQEIRLLIDRSRFDINKDLTDAEVKNDISEKEFVLAESFTLEGNEERIEFASVNTLSKATQSSAVDPLQSNDELKVENCNDTEVNVNTNFDYSKDEIHPSMITIKKEVFVEAVDQRENFHTSTNICHLCHKSFKETRYLRYHLKRHKQWDEQRERPQESCDGLFDESESLEKHRSALYAKTDNKPRVYTCEPCNKTWRSRNSYRLHKQYWHSENFKKPLKQYACEVCGRNFKTSTALKEHISTHTGKRQHLCPDCGKSFSRLSNLTQHRFRHSEVLAFECPQCPKKFRTKNDVSKHKVIHEEIKKHVCNLCGDRFVKTHQLTVHKRRHNGVKPYKCDFCDMRFLNRNGKRTHMRTHTGEKPYKCKYCPRAFSQSGDHIKHLRTHIGDNVYRCELCPLDFRLASELRIHFATHKNDDDETRERNMMALKEEEAEFQIQLAGESVRETQN